MNDPQKPRLLPQIEEQTEAYWQQIKINDLIAKASSERADQFVFYDGPPFANGLPHYGHLLAGSIKDAIVRYHLLKGEGVKLQFGWDTHGLPVEYEIEKELNLSGKSAIEAYGVAKFIEACRASVLRYTKEWKQTIERLGRLGDVDSAYVTMDRDYMESIWWIIKTIHQKGLLELSFKSLPYCTRCATPLSNFETNQGYKDDVPATSVYVKFKKIGSDNEYFLAWTTTPWTLPGNAALAVNAKADYVRVQLRNGDIFVVAEDRLPAIIAGFDYQLIDEVKGSSLVGQAYEPLWPDWQHWNVAVGTHAKAAGEMHHVLAADFVDLDEGTGIVHVAPAFGEDDLLLGQHEGLALLRTVNDRGEMLAPELVAGRPWEQANQPIIDYLTERGRLWRTEEIRHTYPFCWRCDSPLIYFATPAWFVKVSQIRDRLVANNQQISWVPEHIRDGRFGKWLEGARDWAISRNRYWGTPLPIWECQSCSVIQVIGSVAELKEKMTNHIDLADLHRPKIDEVIMQCDECGGEAKRAPDVLDCWFESGAMPYAHQQFPQNFDGSIEKFKQSGRFPATFIAEGLDQTRGWFYTLHVLATILADEPAFKNVIVNGLILAKDGKKLSKRLKNYPPAEEVFHQFGADALRWFLLGSPAAVGEEVRFSAEAVQDVLRKRLMILANVLSFYETYRQLAGVEPVVTADWPKTTILLNRWLVSRVGETTAEVTAALGAYQLPRAVRLLGDLIDDLSLWFVRRSRDNVRADADSARRSETLEVLGAALFRLAHLITPIAPFSAEHLYQTVTASQAEVSVQLSRWPADGRIDESVLRSMRNVREVVSELLRARQAAGIPVKQPLRAAKIVYAANPEEVEIIKSEVNVLTVEKLEDYPPHEKFPVALDTAVTPELERLFEEREFVRLVQSLRKLVGLDFGKVVQLVTNVAIFEVGVRERLQELVDKYAERLNISKEIDFNGLAITDPSVVKTVEYSLRGQTFSLMMFV